MTALFLLLALQMPTWTVTPVPATVGDTVRLVRRVRTAPDVQARLRSLDATALVEPLSAPRAAYAEGALTILYTVALFAPGEHAVAMPDAELLYPDGRVETLTGDTVMINVATVLPAGDPLPPALPARAPLERRLQRSIPLAGLVLGVLALGLGWAAWRRRDRPRPRSRTASDVRPDPPIGNWMEAGEPRAVAAVTADRLRAHIARVAPEAGRHLDTDECISVLEASDHPLPMRELTEVLRSLERARFSPAVPSDVVELVQRAERVSRELEPPLLEEVL